MDPLSPRWNRVWGKGTHNSYHFRRDRNLDPAGEGASEQLLDQMLFEHASSFEFDIRPNIWQAGEFVVLHTDRTDFSQCNPLTECFQMLRTAHYALPDHDPVMVMVELKNTWNTIDSSFDATHTIADLDWNIRQVFGDTLYEPADFLVECPGARTLKECLDARGGWPTLEQLRGKFVVMIMANWNKNYDNWVAYGGQGNIADRAGFPMRSIFKADGSGIPGAPGNNQGSIDSVEEQRARDNSIAWQVEGGGVPYWDVMDPDRRLVVRAWQSDGIGCNTTADPLCRFWWDKGQQDGLNGQKDILGWGGTWYTTDRPWNTFDEHLPDGQVGTISGVDTSRRYRDPKPYLYGTLGASRADIDPPALREPGNKLYVSATGAYFPFLYQTVPESSLRFWETTVSLTRVGDPYGVVRPRIAQERGRGCLRAAASTRDWIEICRSKDGDSGDVTVQDRTVVTVRTMRDGVLTNEPHYASTEHIDSFGALLGMSVENRGLGAIVNLYSTGRVNADGSPDWSLLKETDFPMPLDKQGVATSLDVLFVGTRVKGDDGMWTSVNRCHLPSFDDTLNPQPVPPAIVNHSWPPAGDDACVPQLLRLPAVSDRFSIVTDAAPASAGRADNLFVFAKALDGRILFNQAEPGGAFVGWQEVPGGERTDAALGAGMQANTLFVFAKRPDQRIIFNQAEPGGAFVGWL